MKKLVNKYYKNIISFLIGAILMGIFALIYYSIPSIKYDVNGDGKVTLADSTKIINYYLGKE